MTAYQRFLFEKFPQLLEELDAQQEAKWGRMNAHQMVEHLAQVISIANGRFNATANAEPERLTYRKMRFLEKEIAFPRGVRVDFVSEEPLPTMFPNIQLSKEFTLNQLQRFFDYHTEHADLKPVHPVFGMMNYEEWTQFQARHIKHHLQQFGVLDEEYIIFSI